MRESSDPEHFLVRFSDKWAPDDGTIMEHQKVLAEQGYVWIAKFGRSIGLSRIRALHKQIESGQPTFLVLLSTSRQSPSQPRGAAFQITRVQPASPSVGDPGVPAYYSNFPLRATTWFRASTCIPLQSRQLKEMRVPGSLNEIRETLASSMAGAFRLKLSNSVLRFLVKAETSDVSSP